MVRLSALVRRCAMSSLRTRMSLPVWWDLQKHWSSFDLMPCLVLSVPCIRVIDMYWARVGPGSCGIGLIHFLARWLNAPKPGF